MSELQKKRCAFSDIAGTFCLLGSGILPIFDTSLFFVTPLYCILYNSKIIAGTCVKRTGTKPNNNLAHKIASPFFDLPREIRDHIYEDALGDESLRIRDPNNPAGVIHPFTYSFRPDSTKSPLFSAGLSLWLMLQTNV